jgi:hypothetical protein
MANQKIEDLANDLRKLPVNDEERALIENIIERVSENNLWATTKIKGEIALHSIIRAPRDGVLYDKERHALSEEILIRGMKLLVSSMHAFYAETIAMIAQKSELHPDENVHDKLFKVSILNLAQRAIVSWKKIDEESNQVSELVEGLHVVINKQDVARKANETKLNNVLETCAEIALSVDSGRGNEKIIAEAIRDLKTDA